MNDVCVKLEQVVKRNLAPNSCTSINIQRMITGWGKTIREHFALTNIHMVHNKDETGLRMLKNRMESIINIVKDTKTAIDDRVRSFQITTDQYEHVQKVCRNPVKLF